jgi:hypothetical protein
MAKLLLTHKSNLVDISRCIPTSRWGLEMTYAQILLMGLLSIVALFPKESEARLFAARLIGIEEEALPQVQVSDPRDSGQTNQETSALRRLASALSAGNEAMTHLRGSQTEYREKDRLKLPIPGMECDVDRIVNYVSCYSSVIGTREEAGNRFIRFVNELQSALPSDRWRKVKEEPRIDSTRSYTYEDQGSDAHIDIDLIPRADSYMVTIFGWTATKPRL